MKRGQVSTFIIIGIVILSIFGLVFYYRDLFVEKVLGPEGTRRMLSNQLEFVKVHVEDCIEKYAGPELVLIGKQGGSLTFNNPVNYYGQDIELLCTRGQGVKCVNHMFLLDKIEENLNNDLKNKILICINPALVNDRFNVEKGQFSITTKVEDDFVRINVSYPLKLSRKDIFVEVKDFSTKINYPLGKISYAVNDILNMEALGIDFNPYAYSLQRNNIYIINRANRVYSSYELVFYKVKTIFGDYEVIFAVEKV